MRHDRPPLALFLGLAALAAGGMLLAFGPGAEMVTGILRPFGRVLLEWQREFQNGLASGLRGVAGGEARLAALAGLLGVCLAYGFLHAAGPGHGKAVLAAWAAARPVNARKLVLVGLASALAQAGVAILLALGLAALTGLSRRGIEAFDQQRLAPLALVLTGLIGLWLIWRALRSLRAAPPAAPETPARKGPASAMLAAAAGGPQPKAHSYQAQAYCADPGCAGCSRPHLPDASRLMRATGPAETLAVIATAAVRPCSGALMLLLLSWQMGMLWVGVLGTVAMGLGTAGVTVTLALAASGARGGALRLASARRAPQLAALIEALTGLVLIVIVLAIWSALPTPR